MVDKSTISGKRKPWKNWKILTNLILKKLIDFLKNLILSIRQDVIERGCYGE